MHRLPEPKCTWYDIFCHGREIRKLVCNPITSFCLRWVGRCVNYSDHKDVIDRHEANAITAAKMVDKKDDLYDAVKAVNDDAVAKQERIDFLSQEIAEKELLYSENVDYLHEKFQELYVAFVNNDEAKSRLVFNELANNNIISLCVDGIR